MALCTQADVEHRLQIEFTADPDPVVVALIDAAQGHIERVYGGPVEVDDYTETHSGLGPLFLRHHPLNSIASITEDGVALTVADDVIFTTSGIVYRLATTGYAGVWGSWKPYAIEITYNAGYTAADIPEDIVDVCAWMVAAAIRRGLATSGESGNAIEGITAESLGDWSATYADGLVDPASMVFMTDEQIKVIRYYRMPVLA
jgi:hypothetical protein